MACAPGSCGHRCSASWACAASSAFPARGESKAIAPALGWCSWCRGCEGCGGCTKGRASCPANGRRGPRSSAGPAARSGGACALGSAAHCAAHAPWAESSMPPKGALAPSAGSTVAEAPPIGVACTLSCVFAGQATYAGELCCGCCDCCCGCCSCCCCGCGCGCSCCGCCCGGCRVLGRRISRYAGCMGMRAPHCAQSGEPSALSPAVHVGHSHTTKTLPGKAGALSLRPLTGGGASSELPHSAPHASRAGGGGVRADTRG